MVLVGLVFLTGLLSSAEQPALQTLGAWVRPLHLAVFMHLLLAFPSGRLDSRLAAGLVGAIYLDLGVLYHAPLVLLVLGATGLGGRLYDASFAFGAVLFLAGSVLLAQRWRAGSRAWRRAVALLLRVRLARASVAELVVELEDARPRCAPGSRSWRRHGRGSWRPPTRSASGSSGTSTTAPSSG